MFIFQVLEINLNAYVYFPTMRLHFSTRKLKHACLNNAQARAEPHSASLLCIILRTINNLLLMSKGLVSGTMFIDTVENSKQSY